MAAAFSRAAFPTLHSSPYFAECYQLEHIYLRYNRTPHSLLESTLYVTDAIPLSTFTSLIALFMTYIYIFEAEVTRVLPTHAPVCRTPGNQLQK